MTTIDYITMSVYGLNCIIAGARLNESMGWGFWYRLLSTYIYLFFGSAIVVREAILKGEKQISEILEKKRRKDEKEIEIA